MRISSRIALALLALAGLSAVLAVALVRRRPTSLPPPRFDMAARLAELARQEGTWDNQWDKAAEKVAELSAVARTERDPARRFALLHQVASLQLNSGDADAAIATFTRLHREFAPLLQHAEAQALKAELAFAHLRRGETENCTEHHTADSCLLPIRGGGVHQRRRGSEEALKLYREMLEDPDADPDSALGWRWLFNLGAMTLGQYPEKVPPRWRIPPEAFDSDYDIGRFPEVAASRGIAEFGLAGGVVLEDFDQDGHLDALISHMGIADQLEYFHNDGDGHFTRRTEAAHLTGITGGLNLIQADYDNDGCIDVFVPRGAWLHDHGRFPASLLRNDCHGGFRDVTAEAGLLADYPTQTAAWADVDGDGLLDLFVGYEVDRRRVAWPAGAKNFALYRNNGDGTFTEVGGASGIELEGMIKGVVFGDFDNDGRPDLYVSILGRPNRLFRNLGGFRFEDVTARAGVAEPVASFTTWFFDYDNDGWLDLFVSGYSATLPDVVSEYVGPKGPPKGERPRLYHNNHDGTFTDVSREVGLDRPLLTMGANFGDLDNDGWLDFYLGTGTPVLSMLVPNRMFRNDRGRRFQDVTTSGGFGHLQKGHAVAFGDLSGSGNQDVLEEMGGAFAGDKFWTALYENPGHGNHWVKLRLIGTKSNRFAVGGRIKLVVQGDDGAPREIHALVGSGGSFGASSLRPHLGIGRAITIDRLEIRWPGSGAVQEFRGLPADRIYELREGSPEARQVAPPLKAAPPEPAPAVAKAPR